MCRAELRVPGARSKCPCKGCDERWVTADGRCHTTCERYAQWRGEVQDAKSAREAYINTQSEANAYEVSVNKRFRRGNK